MDVADDIAYSTYDLEDAFKAGFLNPIDILSSDDLIINQIIDKLKNNDITVTNDECREVLLSIFSYIWKPLIVKQRSFKKNTKAYESDTLKNFVDFYKVSKDIATNGYLRTDFTSALVKRFVSGVEIEYNKKNPILSRVYLNPDVLLQVNILKHLAYVCLINSSRLKVAEHRGAEIVKSIFDTLCDDRNGKGIKLISEDFQKIIQAGNVPKRRVICDYIAGMTDRHALEFFNRLFSENPKSIFKPF